jgi:hypothetical protein
VLSDRVGIRYMVRAAVNPVGRGAGRLGRAGRARTVRPAGLRQIRPEADFQIRNSFSFLNLFCKIQINLNSNKI